MFKNFLLVMLTAMTFTTLLLLTLRFIVNGKLESAAEQS